MLKQIIIISFLLLTSSNVFATLQFEEEPANNSAAYGTVFDAVKYSGFKSIVDAKGNHSFDFFKFKINDDDTVGNFTFNPAFTALGYVIYDTDMTTVINKVGNINYIFDQSDDYYFIRVDSNNDYYELNISFTASEKTSTIPEPTSLALLGVGFLFAGSLRRR
ncbi:MAG: PEP-CTERM sorting domain-containing protein [Gammaproteobacteria bacterium]|nr:PEP-CTERM sorting domain-containing protein [Gammaproteobacteria bacterium]